MAVMQTLEFNAASGLTISCKLFALESDTVVDTQTATEKTNDKNRYSVEFADVPAGAYRLNGFVGAVGGFVNEIYDLSLDTDVFIPRSEVGATEISDRIERDGGLLDQVKMDTSTLLSRVTSSVANLWTNLIAMIAGSGGSAAWTATAMGNVGATNVGSGSEEKELTITVDGQPADGVAVWITTDSAGSNVVAGTLYTDALGKVTFMLDAGTYYAWKQKSGANFTNPESFTVTA